MNADTHNIYSQHSTPCTILEDEVRVAHTDFKKSKKCIAHMQMLDDQKKYKLSLFTSRRNVESNKPLEVIEYHRSDVAGLDWGTFENYRKLIKLINLPLESSTYITLVNKKWSITLLFPNDEGEKCSRWKMGLMTSYLGYSQGTVREKLKYNDETVYLQLTGDNISVISTQNGSKPATCTKSWRKSDLYTCDVNIYAPDPTAAAIDDIPRSAINLTMKSNVQGRTQTEHTELIYERMGNVEEIKKNIMKEVITEQFSNEEVYTNIDDYIYTDISEKYYDLNQIDPAVSAPTEESATVKENSKKQIDADAIGSLKGVSEDDMMKALSKIYMKIKDASLQNSARDEEGAVGPRPMVQLELDKSEHVITNVGNIIQKLCDNPLPHPPDTLNLPKPLRTHVGVSLCLQGAEHNWTALASVIGINLEPIALIEAYIPAIQLREPPAEIIFRHWQYTYNHYWNVENSPSRPKLECTIQGLIEALRTIRRYDLVDHIQKEMGLLDNT